MYSRDRNVLVTLVFRAALIAAIAACIGCDGKTTPKDAGSADAGKDALVSDSSQSLDVPSPDMAVGDLSQATDLSPGTDTSKTDTAQVLPDAPPLDGAMGDRPQLTDVDPVIDTGPVDNGSIDVSDALSTQARIAFSFKNTGTETAYIQMECTVQFQVVSEATSTVYPNKSICLCRCIDPTCLDLPNCAPCAKRSGIAVEPGKTYETTWVAQSITIADKTGTRGDFKCVDYAPIPTGAYRVSIPVFSSDSDAAANTNASTASTPFQLTTDDAKVEVPLR
jgi:hypothetical protein